MAGIVLTGGGTAGHIMPCLALLPELKKRFDTITYIGGGGMEKEIVPKYGLPFYETRTIRLERVRIWENIKIPFVLKKAADEAAETLKKVNAGVVFSKGGYAALPSCYAAKALGIPLVIHESDYTMGVANKLTARFAARVFTSFPETKGGEYVGNPIREEIFRGDPERARAKYKLTHRPLILVFGGSLGAEAINKAVYAAAPELTKTHNLFHITGKNGEPIKIKGYTQTDYAYDIADLYALADLVIMRGGANSLSEAAALGKRALSIPLPKGASRGDQLDNAKSYKARGLCDILPQEELTPENLVRAANAMLFKPPPRPEKSSANAKIADILWETAGSGGF